jgi:RHS repeat-associated protein
MSKSTTTRVGGGVVGNDGNSETICEFDSAGNRIASTTAKANGLGVITTTRTEYLTDSQNPTGYSQVLTETEFAVNTTTGVVGAPIKQVVYTIGHDQISQTNLSDWNPVTEAWNLKSEAWFGTDGHGSVRVLYDAAAAMVTASGAQQLYHFDAYGNLLNFGPGTNNPNATPATSYLYSGEAFDFNIGQQYLRARWYDSKTGRFNSLDPFAGNSSDPQSFHKYAYVHGDPIQGVDPTGMFVTWASLQAKYNAVSISAYIWGTNLLATYPTITTLALVGIQGWGVYEMLTNPIARDSFLSTAGANPYAAFSGLIDDLYFSIASAKNLGERVYRGAAPRFRELSVYVALLRQRVSHLERSAGGLNSAARSQFDKGFGAVAVGEFIDDAGRVRRQLEVRFSDN